MINPFILSPNERIRYWRELRDSLPGKTFYEQSNLVSKFWWQAPIQTFAIDYDKPENWPNPWEMIYLNGFDSSARGVMMAETFLLAYGDDFADNIELLYIKDYVEEDMIMIVSVNGYVINHEYNSVKTLDDLSGRYTILGAYDKVGKNWIMRR